MKAVIVSVLILTLTGCTSAQIQAMNEGYERQQRQGGSGGETQYDRTMREVQVKAPTHY